MGKPPSCSNKVNPTDLVLIGDRSISHTPPFLLTYEIFNKNVHNCLVDSGASSNIMPRTVCTKLNITPQKSVVHIVQLDRTKVEVLREMISVSIRLSSNPKVSQIMLAYRLEFQCTNNTTKYEALIQRLYKAIGLDVKHLQVYGDSEIVIKQVRNTIHYVFGHLKTLSISTREYYFSLHCF